MVGTFTLCQADAVISDSCLLDGEGTYPDLAVASSYPSWGAGFVKRWGEKYSRFANAAWQVQGASHLLVFCAGNDVTYPGTDAEALEWGLQDLPFIFHGVLYAIVVNLSSSCAFCFAMYSCFIVLKLTCD